MKYDVSFVKGMFLSRRTEADKWDRLEKLYQDNYLAAPPADKLRIPKIIHQIWLGSPLPEEYLALQDSWKKFHPDWEYHLWTDENIKDLSLINREIFEKTKNLGAKADILRYEILYQFGGLYVDTDFECLKPFDDIHYLADFYAGLLASHQPCIMNSLIGSSSNNAIIKEIIGRINAASQENNPDEIFAATGPLYFTRCFFEAVPTTAEKCLIFPASFFYPSPNYNSGLAHEIQKKYLKDESYAIHYWHISWTKNKKSIIYLAGKILKYLLPYGLIKSYADRRPMND